MERLSLHNRLALLWITISVIGAAFIYSSTYKINLSLGYSAYATVIQQVILIFVGSIVLILIYRFKKQAYKLLYASVNSLFYFSLLSLALIIILKVVSVYFGFEALKRGGAYQVIPLVVFDFQPLEMFKITSILFFAKQVGRPNRTRSFNEVFRPIILYAIGACLILLQPDTGGFLIVSAVLFVLVLINNEYIPKFARYFFIVCGVILLLTFIGSLLSSPTEIPDAGQDYRVNRLQSYVDPFADAQNTGSNIINSALAISNGGLLGQGYLQSTQSTGFLFAANSDFIFAVICEQFGILGAILTIGLLVFISKTCFDIAKKSNTRFGELYAYGFGFLILIQSFINIGGVVGVIPMTGVTLPFISTGLNSYVFLTAGLFAVIIIDLESRRKQRIYDERASSLFM